MIIKQMMIFFMKTMKYYHKIEVMKLRIFILIENVIVE